MRIVGNDPTLSRQITATASGAISAAGKPLIVNTDGTVTSTLINSATESLGSESEFTTGAANYITIAHDSNSGKSVVIYRDDDAKGTARVGTVSGTSISYGTAVEFEDGNTEFIAATFDSNSNKVVIAYRDGGDSNYGKAVVGTVSGTDISFGSPVTFESAHAAYMSATFDSTNNRVVIVYCDLGNSNYGTAIVGTVSGTSISFGTPVVYSSSTTYWQAAGFDTANGKVVINYDTITEIYIGGGSNTGLGIVGTVDSSDNSISFGTRAGWMNGAQLYPDITYDSDSGKFLFVSGNGTNSNRGEAVVATVSGTSISFGTVAVYETGVANYSQVVMDTSANKAVVAFRDQGDSNKGKFNVGTISGTDVSFSGATEFNAATEWIGIEYDSTAEKVLIGYRDQGDGDDGTVRVLQNGFTNEFLTTENFIGTSAHSAADGAKVLVNTQGAIDENQSGLTAGQTFFVDKNGALQLTTNIAQSIGSEVVFKSASTLGTAVTFDSNSNRIVIVYRNGSTGYGEAVVGTVSGTSVSFGTPVVFSPTGGAGIGTDQTDIAFDSNSNKVVIIYSDGAASDIGKAIVGTVDSSDNSISFGTAVTFENADITSSTATITFDSNANKVVISYRDNGNSQYGTSIVGTVSGTSISFGTPVVFVSSGITNVSSAFDSSNNKVLVCYEDGLDNDEGSARVGTVSSTSISFGTAVKFNTNGVTEQINVVFDSNVNKFAIFFKGQTNYGRAVVGTISGTDVSFGSIVAFKTATITSIGASFDSNVNKSIVAYRDPDNSNSGRFQIATISGTSISFGSATEFNAGATSYIISVYDSANNRTLIAYRDEGNSNYGTAIVQQSANDLSGSLSTDAVTAGTALSATKLLVKG